MKENTIRLGAAALAVLLTTAAGVTYTLAQGVGEDEGHHNRGDMKEKHEEVKQAIESGDFTAFQEAVGDHKKFADKITQENFDRLIEAHELMESGDKEGAQAIFEELGIQKGPLHHKRGKKHFGERTSEQRAALKSAIESGDYDAWREVVGDDNRFEDKITEENFEQFGQAHQLMQSGEHDQAREIMEELGFDKRPGKFHGKKGGQTQK